MPKAKYDLNDNGKIDPDERDIIDYEDRRRLCRMLTQSVMLSYA